MSVAVGPLSYNASPGCISEGREMIRDSEWTSLVKAESVSTLLSQALPCTGQHTGHVFAAVGEVNHRVPALFFGRYQVCLEERTEDGFREPDSQLALKFATRALLDSGVA